ncbi:mitochondrial proton/calcium exchanger protein-like isoform X2 [Watersipora subatra]
MEFLLPVALKLFPGLLPSTFKEEDKEKKKLKKRLKAKLEIAKFLQDTVEESALVKSGSGKHNELAKEFKDFLTEIREGGTTVKTEDILKYTQLFKDEITLDNMTREHLVALCKLLEINSIGTTKMIAFQIGVRLRHLKADDKKIYKEGLGTLTESELQQACRARGMRAIGVPEWRLRYQLKQWLDMHLNDKIPISLLLMSRALYLPDTLSTEEKLKEVISSLPENTTAEAEIHAAEVTGEKIDPAAKIKLITAEEEAIAREKKEEAAAQQDKLEETKKQSEVLSAEEDLAKHTLLDKAEMIEGVSQADVTLSSSTAATIKKSTEDSPAEISAPSEADSADQELSSEDIEQLEDVIEKIAEEKQMGIEKSELDTLKEHYDEYQEDLTQLKTLVETDAQIIESKSAKRLSSAVNRMISNLSGLSDDLYEKKQHLLEEIEVNQVKMKRSASLQKEEDMKVLEDSIQKRKDDVISINELVLAMRRLQKIPDETRLQKIAEILDEDHDGQIKISHVLRVLHEIGTENMNIKSSEMKDILHLLKKEEIVEGIELESKSSEGNKPSDQ